MYNIIKSNLKHSTSGYKTIKLYIFSYIKFIFDEFNDSMIKLFVCPNHPKMFVE